MQHMRSMTEMGCAYTSLTGGTQLGDLGALIDSRIVEKERVRVWA
jgi:hypothetical protein